MTPSIIPVAMIAAAMTIPAASFASNAKGDSKLSGMRLSIRAIQLQTTPSQHVPPVATNKNKVLSLKSVD